MFVGKYGFPAAAAIVVVAASVWSLMAKDGTSNTGVGINPLVAAWSGPYGGVPPWDSVRPEVFSEAFTTALAEERAEIDAIASSTEPPTFRNTIEAFDRSGRTRTRVGRLFAVATENITNPQYQALEREWEPKLAAASDAIFMNSRLFARIAAVYGSLASSQLALEQKRLTERMHDLFVRRGARLGEADKAQLSAINQELASLYALFRQKVLADEDTWTVLDSEADLAGLPPALVDSAKAAAAERALPSKWAIVNTRSSVDPFLTFSSRRDLRERVWKKFKSRGDNGDQNDTKTTIARIVKLRADRARLLGFASHAHWRMSDTMAKEPTAAQALMMQVWPAAVSRVREEVADMEAIASREHGPATIEPWDYLYYAEKVRKQRYDLDQSEVKPYLALNNMVAAALWAAEQRYGISFTEITGKVPVFHPDVLVWEVKDAATGTHVGLFYFDGFARPAKRSGAWAMTYRTQEKMDGSVTPIASNNNNFVKGAPGAPALISLDDAETLFHEFGHALHALLQDVTYPGLASTPRDFVEFPSQVNEHWVLTREVLDRFARHYQTGQPMPQALVEKIEKSRKFNQGYATVEYLAAAILDMDLHTRPDGVFDPATFERDALARIGMPREIALRHRLPQFDHLFGSDSYSAGYYSYLWSDVMAADTWKAFLEAGGPWDKTVAKRFREIILAEGNSTDRAEAYRRFRGHDPDVKALFENRGFPIN
ncbi:MAG TPA: M3 family metallopeptidase [Vicinamibacterales bacterium]|jgi:peptidyl-dipeptidase Dcp|nr:M3 family metallopeptidase [Vicinamibacterales bacterium]